MTYPGAHLPRLNAVPFGADMLIDHPVFAAEVGHLPRDELIEQLMELVVPIH